jgi:hypothetical protein
MFFPVPDIEKPSTMMLLCSLSLAQLSRLARLKLKKVVFWRALKKPQLEGLFVCLHDTRSHTCSLEQFLT